MLGVNKESLQAQVREVQARRTALDVLMSARFIAETDLEKTEAWAVLQDLKARQQLEREALINEESALREMVLVAFRETGDKAPVQGVTIKQFKHVDFNPSEAMAWCKINSPTMVKEILDPSYAKIAESLPGAPIEVRYEPRVTIATDLSKAVTE